MKKRDPNRTKYLLAVAVMAAISVPLSANAQTIQEAIQDATCSNYTLENDLIIDSNLGTMTYGSEPRTFTLNGDNYKITSDSSTSGEIREGIRLFVDSENPVYGSKLITENIKSFSGFTKNYQNETARGGAIYVDQGILEINNTVFENNKVYAKSSLTDSNKNVEGGAVYVVTYEDGGNLNVSKITSSTFRNNSAETHNGDAYAGAMYSKGNLQITNSTFDNNSAITTFNAKTAEAGALKIVTSNSVNQNIDITGSSFTNNTAGNGINNNVANGGAMSIYSGKGATVNITDSNYTNNKAISAEVEDSYAVIVPAYANGGAIYVDSEKPVTLNINNSSFSKNSAYSSNSDNKYAYGGAIALMGNSESSLNIGNVGDSTTTFSENFSGYGGAIYNRNAQMNINNASFTSNSADFNGGAIFNTGDSNASDVLIQNSTFTNNSSKGKGGAIYNSYSNNLTLDNVTFSGNVSNKGKSDEIYNDIYNDGLLTFSSKGSTLDGGITGRYGTTTVSVNDGEAVVIGTNGRIVQQSVDIKSGKLELKNATNTSVADGILVREGADLYIYNGTLSGEDSANTISGDGTTTIVQNVTNNANISTQINNLGTLTSNANKIQNTVANSGTYKITGGTIAHNITGSGTVQIQGNSTNNATVANNLTVSGATTTLTNNSSISGAVTNGGILSNTSTGILSGAVTNNKTLNNEGRITGSITNASGATLTSNADKIENTVTNSGTYNVTGGTVAHNITGSGTVKIQGNSINNAAIANKVTVSGATTTLTNNSTISGAVTNGGILSNTSTGILSGKVTNNKTLNNEGRITGSITNASGATLTSNADKIENTVANSGTFNITGGTITHNITGSGTINNTGTLNSNASYIQNTMNNSNTLNLTGGTVTKNITGTGTTNINGNVTNNSIISNAIELLSGSLDNTNGRVYDIVITNGTLKSNATKTGTVTNSGTYEITGGTINNTITGAGSINITGNIVNNTVNNITGAVSVAAGRELAVGASGDTFASASSVTMNNNSTLNLQNGSAVSTNINNFVIAENSTVNLKIDWNDSINTTNPSNISGKIQISSVDLTGTDGSKQTYKITNTSGITDKISVTNPVEIKGSGLSNFVKYNNSNGDLTSYKNSLLMAVTDTESGETATYNMVSDETADGGELDGALTIQGNGHSITSGGIVVGSPTIRNADLTIKDANLENITGDAITIHGGNKAHIYADTQDVSITGNTGNAITLKKSNDGVNDYYAQVDINAGDNVVTIDDDIVSDNANNKIIFKGGKIQFNGNFDPASAVIDGSEVTRDGQDTGIAWTLTDGTLIYTDDSYLNNSLNSITFNGGNLDTRNGAATTFNLAGITMNGDSNFYADADLANSKMDSFGSTPVTYNSGTLHVAEVTLLSDASSELTQINFTSDSNLKGHVDYTGEQEIPGIAPVYKYDIDYDNETGNFKFKRLGSGGYTDYNPGILSSSVGAQLGGYLTQLNSYDEAFRNMDSYMLLPYKERQSMKTRNKTASLDNVQYDNNKSVYERKGGWFRPYATFEKVPLHNGPKVSNIAYGSFFGGDSSIAELGHGWDGMWGVYAGYNGSHQSYDGVGIYQNGGTLGLTGMLCKNNFFIGSTANVGASAGESNYNSGRDDFTLLMAGAAIKTGYNWELADGKFIIQPSTMFSYSMVNNFNYTNAAGVRINSNALHAIQIEPGLRFIGNLKNGWQPYAGVSMVFNILDRTHFWANDVALPSLSINPYVRYGVGISKASGERLTGYLQTFIMNGGRNGIGVQTGFRYALGK